MMRKTAAIVQLIIILVIVGFGTYHLYQGNFEVSVATMPLLLIYYFLVVGFRKKEQERKD
jgi:Ca2+/Na+ antiporter